MNEPKKEDFDPTKVASIDTPRTAG
jgi:hypothetical protein